MGTGSTGKEKRAGRASHSMYFLLFSFGDEKIGDSFPLSFPLSTLPFLLSGG